MDMLPENRPAPAFHDLDKRRFGFSKVWKTCRLRRAPWIGLALLGVITCTVQAVPVPRLGIVNKNKDAALADLLFSKFAASGRVELVERDRLNAALKEIEFGSTARANNIKLGQRLQADGLLFIEPETDVVHVVLVAADRGERLLDILYDPSDTASLERTSALVQHQVLSALSKLTAAGDATRHIAVLPLEREDGVPPRWPVLDRLSFVLAAQLGSISNLAVVERRNLEQLVQEKNFTVNATTDELSRADFILRGVATRTETDPRRLRLTLRLASTRMQGLEVATFEVNEADLSPCVSQVLAWITQKLGQRQPADAQTVAAEAEMYFANAQVARARRHPEPLSLFEMAYLLQQTNWVYASGYIAELRLRIDSREGLYHRPVVLALPERCNYFLRALDVAQSADPERHHPCVPLPGFLHDLPPHGAAVSRLWIPPLKDHYATAGVGEKMARIIAAHLSAMPGLGHSVEYLNPQTAVYFNSEMREAGLASTHCEMGGYLHVLEDHAVSMQVGIPRDPNLPRLNAPFLHGALNALEPLGEQAARMVARDFQEYRTERLPPLSPDEYEAFIRRVIAYYHWYCGMAQGLPDAQHRTTWVDICPVFYDQLEDVIAQLKQELAQGDFDRSVLAKHRYLTVAYWDRERAQRLWKEFLESQLSGASVQNHYHILRALCARPGFAYYTNHESARETAVNQLFAWLCTEDHYLGYLNQTYFLERDEFWPLFETLTREHQDVYWKKLVMPRLGWDYHVTIDSQGAKRVRVQTDFTGQHEPQQTYFYLVRRCRDEADADRMTLYAHQVRQVLRDILAHHMGQTDYSHCLTRFNAAESQYQHELAPLLKGRVEGDTPKATSVGVIYTSIPHAVLLFDLFRDVPEISGWSIPGKRGGQAMGKFDQWPHRLVWSNLFVDDSCAHIAFAMDNKCSIALANIHQRTIEVFHWQSSRTPRHLYLEKLKDVVLIAGAGDMLLIPVTTKQTWDTNKVSVLGVNQGFPSMEKKEYQRESFYDVTATGADEGSFYIGITQYSYRQKSRSGGTFPPSYNGVFCWHPEMPRAEAICATDALTPGPLNDCQPYYMEAIDYDSSRKALLLCTKQSYGDALKWWRYFPQSRKWEKPSAQEIAVFSEQEVDGWRLRTSTNTLDSCLVRQQKDLDLSFFTYSRVDLTIRQYKTCPAGLLLMVYQDRPMLYLIPRDKWTVPETKQ
jgi:TolB-like protein